VGKKIDGVLQQGFLYRDAIKPVVELDGAGNVVSRFVYGSNPITPDYVIKGGNTYKIFSDQIGSPRVVVDVSSGSIVERIDYDERGIRSETRMRGSSRLDLREGLSIATRG
jgi:hypothetical protein